MPLKAFLLPCLCLSLFAKYMLLMFLFTSCSILQLYIRMRIDTGNCNTLNTNRSWNFLCQQIPFYAFKFSLFKLLGDEWKAVRSIARMSCKWFLTPFVQVLFGLAWNFMSLDLNVHFLSLVLSSYQNDPLNSS